MNLGIGVKGAWNASIGGLPKKNGGPGPDARKPQKRQNNKTSKRRRKDNFGMAEIEESQRAIVALELFSGIGGMHFALRETGITNVEVAAAMDISDVANKVYKHNFPETNHVAGNICGLTAKK